MSANNGRMDAGNRPPLATIASARLPLNLPRQFQVHNELAVAKAITRFKITEQGTKKEPVPAFAETGS